MYQEDENRDGLNSLWHKKDKWTDERERTYSGTLEIKRQLLDEDKLIGKMNAGKCINIEQPLNYNKIYMSVGDELVALNLVL